MGWQMEQAKRRKRPIEIDLGNPRGNYTKWTQRQTQVRSLETYSGTSSVTSQRVLVSEACCHEWKFATLDGKKAFLNGVTYKELSELTGEPHREGNFEITEEVSDILRKFPEFELFDLKLPVLTKITPGADPKNAPRRFAIKLKRATHDGSGTPNRQHTTPVDLQT